jgi:hypothetical protein
MKKGRYRQQDADVAVFCVLRTLLSGLMNDTTRQAAPA